MQEAFSRGTEIANRWPMLVMVGVLMGGFGYFAYDLNARSDKRESELNASHEKRETEAREFAKGRETALIALLEKYANHIKERNTEMTRMLQSCIVVSDDELRKMRQNDTP